MSETLTLESIVTFLLETPMFRDLDAGELAEIVRIMQIQRIRDGQIVFREGEPGDAWFVVHRGEVSVSKARLLGPSDELARLGRAGLFGEMAMIDSSPRSATVTAVGDGTLFRFPKVAFDTLIAEGDLAAFKLVHEMAKVLCARQRRLTQRLTELMADASGHSLRGELMPVIGEHSVSE